MRAWVSGWMMTRIGGGVERDPMPAKDLYGGEKLIIGYSLSFSCSLLGNRLGRPNSRTTNPCEHALNWLCDLDLVFGKLRAGIVLNAASISCNLSASCRTWQQHRIAPLELFQQQPSSC